MTSLEPTPSMAASSQRGVRLWIASLCVLVFAMVVVGGITRLTRSGLSIVEWRPVTGVVPPLGEEAWQAEFEAYQRFPEFQQVNHQMTLGEFKGIYFWEYMHRLLGRVIGLALAVPLVILALRRRLTAPLVRKLVLVFALGGLQGAVGWYMVQSGLVNVPRVSHYRLATHLGLAFFLFAFLFWILLDLREERAHQAVQRRSAWFAVGITALLAVQIIYGAFVAGMRAGYGFNTFPLMNGHFVPEGVAALVPVWLNALENPATVQFIHRLIAYALAAAALAFWLHVRRTYPAGKERRAATYLLLAVAGQFVLGVTTLLLVVPVTLGVLHQVGAFVLLAAAVYANFVFARPVAASASEGEAQRDFDAVAEASV